MRVVITAGGLSEPIDSFRAITNHSTGRLGSVIAEEFLARGDEVVYICSSSALRPSTHCPTIIANTAREVKSVVEDVLLNQSIEVFVHSMAVSDFEVESISPELVDGKMPSDAEHPCVILRQTPKIIDLLKKISPKTRVVGFKLLKNVPEEKLLEIAAALCSRADCEFVVANLLEEIGADFHVARLVDRDSSVLERCGTKNEIAQAILKVLLS
ncbi:MAG: hypothetical protein LBQ41_01045 [Candidatus Ancillula sp.]|jgi:phosphopantothenate-cysteine ligase|nr:hypothetical protein [Candidatus Ancillula sp.]